MQIIDSQVHIWAPETPDKPWDRVDAAKPHRPKPLGCEDLLREMDRAGVARAVLVPPTWEADRNDTSLEAARLHPDRFAVMGRLTLDAPESRERIATWKDQPGMLGIRLTFHRGRYQSWLDGDSIDWFWEAAERYDIPVMVLAPQALPRLGEVAKRHPGLRLAIDHMGLNSSLVGKPLAPIIDGLINLAVLPNVVVKASALPCYSTEKYPYSSLHPQVRRVVDAFGPKRVFWGTDLSHLPCPYSQALTLFTEELDNLSNDEKEWILGRAIAEWLDWPLLESA